VFISWVDHILITAARTFIGPEIEELEKELTRVIEDFGLVVNLEHLKRVREAGKYLFLNGITFHSQ
jgi:hypothetical protein